ncbi:MAG: tetratricopeptide repeat protein [Candidatus Kerfeldbacteria bacterium]
MNFKTLFKKSIFNRQKDTDTLGKVIEWIMIGLVFVLPIFFLSVSSSPLEFNKTLLFQIVVFIITGLYLWRLFILKKINFNKTFLDWFILAFLFFNLISFLFSKNYYISTVGISGYFSASIISIVSYILFFYLIINIFRDWEGIKKLIYSFWWSGIIIVLFNLFQLGNIHILPWEFTQNINFNLLANSSLTLAIFSLIIFVLSFGFLLFNDKKWLKITAGIVTVLSLILILLLNKVLIIYLLVGILLIWLLKIIFLDDKKLSKLWIIIPTLLVVLLLVFILIDFTNIIPEGVSDSIFLNQKTSASIAWDSFVKSPLFGSGPQTFVYDFTLLRPEMLNSTGLWDLQFLKSGSEFWNIFTTIGLGGMLAFVLLGMFYIKRGFFFIMSYKQINSQSVWLILIFSISLIIFVVGFFIPFNFIIYWMFWLFLAIGISLFKENKKDDNVYEIKLNNKSKEQRVFLPIIIIFSAGIILFLVFGLRVWLADYNYTKVQDEINSGEDMDNIFKQLDKAIDLNKYESKYYLTLAQGYTTQVLLVSQTEDVNSENIRTITQQVINNINLAKQYDEGNSLVYKKSAIIYDSLRPIVGNVDELAVKDYLLAVELEPNNPLIHFNLGRSKLLLAQTILTASNSESSLAEAMSVLDYAIQDFEKTRQLKENYLLVDYNIGLVYQTKGEYDKSLELFIKELNRYPDAIDLLWQVAFIFELKGDIDKSIEYLERIIVLDVNNQTVLQKIEELNKSLSEINPKEIVE